MMRTPYSRLFYGAKGVDFGLSLRLRPTRYRFCRRGGPTVSPWAGTRPIPFFEIFCVFRVPYSRVEKKIIKPLRDQSLLSVRPSVEVLFVGNCCIQFDAYFKAFFRSARRQFAVVA